MSLFVVSFRVMAGLRRSKNGVASLACDPAIPVRKALHSLSGMPGTRPGMTMERLGYLLL
jgi:hypothetical protein